MSDIDQRLDQQDNKISALQRAFTEAAMENQAKADKARQEEVRSLLIEMATQGFDKSSAYANVIIVAGYAGVFGIWSLTKEQLTANTSATVALLVGFSLLIFVVWELAKMILTGRHNAGLAKLLMQNLTPQKFFAEKELHDAKSKRLQLGFMWAWYPVLAFSILPGVTGGGILFYNFAATLMGWCPWP